MRDAESGGVLTSHQASILDHLDERDPLTLGELAQHMGVTPGTMSIHVDRLEAMGYVRRRRSRRDGRQVELRLTADGVRVRDDKSVLDPALVRAMLKQLSAEEREAAIHGLGLLARAANASMAKKSAGRKAAAAGGGGAKGSAARRKATG